jgi:hypothetical protein
MAESNNNPIAGYIEAQMAGTAGIVQAAMHGMQRVQEIVLRAMREGADERVALARSITQARDASDFSRMGEAHAGPAAEQFSRYQQELLGAVTEMNTELLQASYSMVERVGQAFASSGAALGMPAGQGNPMAAFQAGMRQWQGTIAQMTQGAGFGPSRVEAAEEDEDVEVAEPQERPARRAAKKRTGRR